MLAFTMTGIWGSVFMLAKSGLTVVEFGCCGSGIRLIAKPNTMRRTTAKLGLRCGLLEVAHFV
jgi:hypothetical protein